MCVYIYMCMCVWLYICIYIYMYIYSVYIYIVKIVYLLYCVSYNNETNNDKQNIKISNKEQHQNIITAILTTLKT